MTQHGTSPPVGSVGNCLKLVLVGLAAISVAVVTACGYGGSEESGGSSDGPVGVGTIMSTTGVLAPFGIPEQNAIELAFRQANEDGGVAGREIEMTSYDPKGETAAGVSQTRRLLDQDQVEVIVGGGASSGVALGMQQVLEPANVFFATAEASPELTSPAEDHPTTFQTTFTSQLVVDRMLQYLEDEGATSVAFLADSSEYGQSGLAAAEASAEKFGLDIEGISYAPETSDLKPQLTNASKSSPDAYINWTATPSGVVYMKNAEALGLKDEAIVMQGFTFSNPELMKQAGSAGEGVIVSAAKVTITDDLPEDDPQRQALEKFTTAYEEAYDEPVTIYAAQAYDAARITLRALEATDGDTDAEAMASALEGGEPYTGTMGTFEYSADDHFGLSVDDVVITEWNGSDFELVDDSGSE